MKLCLRFPAGAPALFSKLIKQGCQILETLTSAARHRPESSVYYLALGVAFRTQAD